MPIYLVFILGCVGGAIPDLLRLVAVRREGAPAYLRSSFFWVSLVLLMAIGGSTALLVGADKTIEALALGFTAPESLSRLLGGSRSEDRGPTRSLRGWWAT